MNEVIKKALEIDEYNNKLPKVEVGDEVELFEIWDGEGEFPEQSCSYHLTDAGSSGEENEPVWIDYQFEIVSQSGDCKENPIVKITEISFL